MYNLHVTKHNPLLKKCLLLKSNIAIDPNLRPRRFRAFYLLSYFRSGILLTGFRLDHCRLDLRDGGSGTEKDNLDRLIIL